MLRALAVPFFVLLTGSLPAMAAENDPAAQALVQSVRDGVPKTTVFSKVVLSSSRGWSRELEISAQDENGTISSFIEVIAPIDVKDTRFLFYERTNARDEQHIYVPLLKRAMAIADDTRKQAFLGSDFYVSDLVAPEIGLYDYQFVGEKKVLDRNCKLVQTTPKDPTGELYSRAIFAVDPTDKLILETEFFDPSGKLLKVWSVQRVEQVEGHWTIREHEMVNVQDKTSSKIVIETIDYDVELPMGTFTRARLLR